MRFIPTQAHGWIDYVLGVILVISPWLLGFAAGGPDTWVTLVLGLAVIAYSLLTDYELGAAKLIPMNVHLGIDIAVGIVLLVSPWLFNFAALVWIPHVILGILLIAAGVFTETRPRRRAGAHEQERRAAA